jgi:lactoylglutathione lyase
LFVEVTAPASAGTDSWAKRFFAVTLFVDDLLEAKRFYHDVFEMPVLNEDATSCAFQFPGTIINLVTAESAVELLAPAEVGGRGTSPRMLLTLEVRDVDAVCVRLRARGVEFPNGPIDRAWGPRTATFADPSGHCWELSN